MTDYLSIEEERKQAILKDTKQKFKFEHQDIQDIEIFKGGIFENKLDINPFGIPVYLTLQDNHGAGVFVRENSSIIEAAANEFGIEPNLIKAVIYTEMSRGWYDYLDPRGAKTILPGKISKEWAKLISGSDPYNKHDNIRITAKLLSQIEKRLDKPYPEDIYSLYNGLAHDRTYVNAKTKNTPYYLKKVLEARAWEHSDWHLSNKPDLSLDSSGLTVLSDAEKLHRKRSLSPLGQSRQEDVVDTQAVARDGEQGTGGFLEPTQRSPIVIPRSTFNLFSDLTTMTTAALERERRENRLVHDGLTDGKDFRGSTNGVGQVTSRFEPWKQSDLDVAQTDDDVTLHGGKSFVPRFPPDRRNQCMPGEEFPPRPVMSGARDVLPGGMAVPVAGNGPDLPGGQ